MDSRDRRGQLILVAAFGLAVAFVVLALVLNTVVFTENLATRNHDRTDGAIAFEGAVEGGVGGLVSEANRAVNASADDDAAYESLRAELEATIPTWSDNATYLGATRGTLRSATLAGTENGTQLVQSNATEFTNGILAPSVNETRRFQLLVTPESETGVTVSVTDGSDSWSVTVSENSTDGTQTDVVAEGSGDTLRRTVDANTTEVDVTEGLVNGTRVENWTFGEGVDTPYTVSISTDSATTGKYVLFVDERVADSGTVAPTAAPAIYRAFVDISVRTDVLTYESNVAVAPSDPVGNETYTVGG